MRVPNNNTKIQKLKQAPVRAHASFGYSQYPRSYRGLCFLGGFMPISEHEVINAIRRQKLQHKDNKHVILEISCRYHLPRHLVREIIDEIKMLNKR